MAKKILIVDDEADIRTTVKTVLEKEGYQVIINNLIFKLQRMHFYQWILRLFQQVLRKEIATLV
jgi:CheY-like chemotaxis protein